MIKSKGGGKPTARHKKSAVAVAQPQRAARQTRQGRQGAGLTNKVSGTSSNAKKPTRKSAPKATGRRSGPTAETKPVVVKHAVVVPEGLPKKYFLKSTFNTHDIMHAPVEKTLKMLDKILAGERLFTM